MESHQLAGTVDRSRVIGYRGLLTGQGSRVTGDRSPVQGHRLQEMDHGSKVTGPHRAATTPWSLVTMHLLAAPRGTD